MDEVMTMKWTPVKKAVAACAAIGVGLLIVSSRKRYHEHNHAPVVLDPELDSDTRKVVLAALTRETDLGVLHLLATKLDAAGYDESAKVVRERLAQASRSMGHAVGQGTVWNIRGAQRMLQKLGYDVPLSGVDGPRTRDAVAKFQSLHDLDVDGIIGKATFRMLRAVTGGV